MYATVGQYLGDDETPHKTNLARRPYVPHKSHVSESYENYANHERRENYVGERRVQPTAKHVCMCSHFHKNTADPKVWGPKFWYSLHNSAAHYPMNASPLVRSRMKGRILAIPYEIPCPSCQGHASAFIESHKDQLDQIVSNRHALGKFYCDFHNKVNQRHGKRIRTYDEVYNHYSGQEKMKD